MENAADALKIVFAVFVFVVGLAVLFYMASLCQETARVLITETDKTQYYSYMDSADDYGDLVNTDGNRIVEFKDIIPVIYRYAEENYGVTIIDSGEIVARFDLDTESMVNSWVSASNATKDDFVNYVNEYIVDSVSANEISASSANNYLPMVNLFKSLYSQNTSGTISREYYCAWSRIF